jgi:hypothetical protein
MRIVRAEDLEWKEISKHRSGDIVFKTLLCGEPDALDNYELSLTRRGEGTSFYAPRHHHNFDQLRYGIEGVMNHGPHEDLLPGMVGYFPEGTHYGPQDESGECISLVYQGGGASGAGFLSYENLGEGQRQLSQLGTFENGAYRGLNREGRTISKDSYQAIWEHMRGREMHYPTPRFDRPIVMHPEAFEYIAGADGLAHRHMGTFNERGFSLSFLKVSAGQPGILTGKNRLLFVIEGALEVEGNRASRHTAIELGAAERATLSSSNEAVLLEIVRPRFDVPFWEADTAQPEAQLSRA